MAPDHAPLDSFRVQDEPEIRRALARTLKVRALGAESQEMANVWFFETLVRVHRLGEGEPYTGLKPAGMDHAPAVSAADRALASGSPLEVEQLLAHAVRDGIRERFERATAAKSFAANDLTAGRAFVAAYVAWLHYVEGVHAAAAAGEHADAAKTPSAAAPGHGEH